MQTIPNTGLFFCVRLARIQRRHSFQPDPEIPDLKMTIMPCTAALVRAINALCVAGRKGEARAEFPPNGRTFRGTAFSNEHRQFFVPGMKYRAPGFVATSFDEITALGFAVRHGLDLGKPADVV